MSVSDSWSWSESGRRAANREAEHPMAELADRLAEARRAGDPAPEELERLVGMLAKGDIDPGDRLTRALEGFARMSEERRGARAEQRSDSSRSDRLAFGARAEEARYAPPRSPISDELEARLADFAGTLPGSRSDERREPARREEPRRAAAEPRPQAKAAPTPPIASLRAALAEIAERQKALDADVEASAGRRRHEEPVRREEPMRQDARRPAEATPARFDRREPEPRQPILPQQEFPRAAPDQRATERDYRAAGRATASYAAAPSYPPAPSAAPVVAPAMQELRAELERLGRSVADLPTRNEIDRMTREMADLAKRLTSNDRPARLDRESLSAIDQLVAEVDRMRSDAPSPQAISKLSEEVHAISARLEVLGPSSANAIDALARRVDDVRSELGQFPRVAAVDGVAREIQNLIARLDAQEAVAAPTRDAVVGLAGRVNAMDGQIAAIAQATAARDEALDRINTTLRTELDDLPRATAVLDLGRQIDALTEGLKSRSAIGPALAAVEGLAGKVEALDDRIATIASMREEDAGRLSDLMRGEFAAAATPAAFEGLGRRIEALDDRIASIASRREEDAGRLSDLMRGEFAAAATPAAFEGLGRRIEALDDRIASIASRRDEELGRLTDLMRGELSVAATPADFEELGRRIAALDDRIASIASRREEELGRLTDLMRGELSVAATPAAFEGLGRRIEALDDRIVSIASRREEDVNWLSDTLRDEIAAVARPNEVDGLSRQIAALTDRISEERRTPVVIGVDALTSRIDDLGERFEDMAAATRARGAAFEQIEQSIRTIADQMHASRSTATTGASALEAEVVRLVESLDQNDGKIEDLHRAFTGLAGRIERSFADLGVQAAQSAAAAARDMLGGETVDGKLDSELAAALSDLRASATQSERRAADTLDAVRSTLERLLDRMENQPESVRNEVPNPPYRQFGLDPEPRVENATEVARAAAMRAMREIADTPPPAAAHFDDQPNFRSYGDFGPDHPLEPGAGLPRAEGETVPPAPTSAASLIASARRAKQQVDTDPLADPQSAKIAGKRASVFAGALDRIKKSNRPILLGVVAVLVVFSALYVASRMTGEPEQAPPPPAPQSRLAPAEQPRNVMPETKVSAAAEAPPPVEREPDTEDFASAEDGGPNEPPPAAAEPVEAAKVEATKLADVVSPVAVAPRAPARDLSSFAFAEAGAAAKTRADWKTAEPASTGSIRRDPNALPEDIGGATLKSRALSGDAAAEIEVGDRLLDGRGVAADPAAAARWFEKAAAQGSAPAQHRLGSLYEKGRGVTRDVAAARRWYEQAAASGNVRAMHNLGVVHAEGGLGKPDYGAAMVWFRMAAERGLNDSGYNLAVLAARGLGGKRDLVEAYKWFALAAEDGDADAAKKRDEIGKALGSTVTVAKAAVTAFRAKPIDPAANHVEAPAGGWDRVAARKDAGPVTR